MEIKPINTSLPDYITRFIEFNKNKLIEIYQKEIQKNKIGCLGLKCSVKDNKMDVYFMNETMVLEIIPNNEWVNIQKKQQYILIIHDIDLMNTFILYI